MTVLNNSTPKVYAQNEHVKKKKKMNMFMAVLAKE